MCPSKKNWSPSTRAPIVFKGSTFSILLVLVLFFSVSVHNDSRSDKSFWDDNAGPREKIGSNASGEVEQTDRSGITDLLM